MGVSTVNDETLKDRHEMYADIGSSDWLNLEEAAIYLRLFKKNSSEPNTGSLRNLICQGRLPFYKPFGRILLKKSELNDLIHKSMQGGYKRWRLR